MKPQGLWGSHRGAVSITFDDGEQCQLDKAVPIMNEHGIKGTFYINPYGDDWKARFEPWIEVGQAGHEIGNHSKSHICSKNYLGSPHGLEDMTLDEIEADILEAHERLVPIAPHQKVWTFAYPCYNTEVGVGLERKSYAPVVAKHFLAGRVGGEYGFGNYPGVIDLACVWGLPMVRMSGFEMIGLVEELTARGQWVVLAFHEIDGARLTVGSHDFEMLVRYLHRRRDEIWTAPFVEVAQKIADARTAA